MKNLIFKSCLVVLGATGNMNVALADTTVPTFTYKINLIDENNDIIRNLLTDEEAYVGKSITYSYPKYLTDSEGKVTYECTASTFSQTVSATEGGSTNVSYRKYEGVAQFFEAESLNLSTNASKDVSNKNCSSWHAIKYINANSPIYSIGDDGVYCMTMAVATARVGTNSSTGTPYSVTFTVNQDEDQLLLIDNVTWSANDIQKKGMIKTDNLELEKGKTLLLTTSPNKNAILDYVLMQKTASRVSVSAAKYATWVSKDNVVVPEDVKVYGVKENETGTGILLTEVKAGTVIPTGTSILVNASEEKHYFAVTTTDGESVSDNNLRASDGTVVSDGKTYYALGKFADKVGFALVEQGVPIPEGKAYLKVANASGAKFINIGTETTGVADVFVDSGAKHKGVCYSLDGKIVTQPTHGIYIRNGKKMIGEK